MDKIKLLILACMIASLQGFSQPSNYSKNNSENEVEIMELLENYKTSINQIDTTLAKIIWLPTSEVSFIHPRGHEKGWKQIKSGIYEMFNERFTQRDLKSYNEAITVYGDMAVLEFYWVFDAIYRGENPKKMQTKGRETQVLKKIDNQWKIVHVHYSGMPKTGEREGF